MRAAKIILTVLLASSFLLVIGCDECNDLRFANNTQRKRIKELESEIKSSDLQRSQMERQLASYSQKEGIEAGALQDKVITLEQALANKQALIDSMKNQLISGGVQLPVELSAMLEDFANNEDMVTFDSSKGLVKFKSDLLFEKGSDKVAPSAVQAVKKLCGILASDEAAQFDVIVAGHSDDMKIGPVTRKNHPTGS